MRDRLIELIKGSSQYICEQDSLVKRIADYLLAEGVFVLPYKAGQVVYVLRSQTSNGKNLYLREEHIDHYRIFGKRLYMCFFSERLSVPDYLWEKTVFLSREEAEKAIAERSEE